MRNKPTFWTSSKNTRRDWVIFFRLRIEYTCFTHPGLLLDLLASPSWIHFQGETHQWNFFSHSFILFYLDIANLPQCLFFCVLCIEVPKMYHLLSFACSQHKTFYQFIQTKHICSKYQAHELFNRPTKYRQHFVYSELIILWAGKK